MEPTICPYLEPDQSSPIIFNLFLLGLNLTLSSIYVKVFNMFVPLIFPHQNPIHTSPLPYVATNFY